MSKRADWIERRLREAKQSQPLVTDAVAKRVRSLLENVICDKGLSRKELSETATELINDMASVNGFKKEGNHED